MKQFFFLFFLILLATTARAELIPVDIQGHHGRLSAVIQKSDSHRQGRMPMVIICHGFTADKEGFLLRLLADSLEANGIASLRFDFNGHGQSEGTESSLGGKNHSGRAFPGWRGNRHGIGHDGQKASGRPHTAGSGRRAAR